MLVNVWVMTARAAVGSKPALRVAIILIAWDRHRTYRRLHALLVEASSIWHVVLNNRLNQHGESRLHGLLNLTRNSAILLAVVVASYVAPLIGE
jgi:hypothetical protein